MDRFSELVSKGVAAFNYQPIANDSVSCPVCRQYNNIFSIATDTHMACYGEDSKIITGTLISDYKMFDQFIWSSMFRGVNFTHAGVNSFADWMHKLGMCGHYEMINGQAAYILSPVSENETNTKLEAAEITSYVTSESKIPHSSKYLSRNIDFEDFMECIKDNPYDTAKALNENRYIFGKNWTVANLSEGVRIVGSYNGVNYKLQA